MKNLSPAAQQVFWAFNEAASGKPDDWHYLPSIAAALRAAADQPYEIPRGIAAMIIGRTGTGQMLSATNSSPSPTNSAD